MSEFTRRQVLAGLGVAALGAACTTRQSSSAGSHEPGSIQALLAGASQASVLGTGTDAPPMNPGVNRLGLILATNAGQVIEGDSPQVWLARSLRSKATGPFKGTWHPFTAYDQTGDRSPRSPLPGAFAVEVNIPSAGVWNVGVTAMRGSKRYAGTGLLQVKDGHVVAGLGTKAISTPTPVATTTSAIEQVCTRTPVDHMHYISLDRALRNGKPTVVSFGTPLLCTSRLCGPVVDEQLLAFQQTGKAKANFIHVEEFLPGPDRKPPPATLENISPAFKVWGFTTDPWIVIIDRTGVIRFRSLGPITAPEIEQALEALEPLL